MVSFLVLIALTVILSIWDIKSMKKANLKKEITPYILLMLVSGIMGFLYFTDPFRKSIAIMFLDLLNIDF